MKVDQKYVDIATDLVQHFEATEDESEQEEILVSLADEDLAVLQALIESSALGQ